MAVFDELKSIASVLREADKIEQFRQILDVQEKLLEMQKRIADLEQENAQLKNKLETQENLIFERNSYWIKKGNLSDGPFCSRCWDDEKKTVRMQPRGNPAYYSCPNCDNSSVLVYPEKDRPIRAIPFYPNSSK